MSSLFFHRSDQPAGDAISDLDGSNSQHPNTLSSILIAAGARLPFIGPDRLAFDKQLGKGNSFKVNREIYSPINDTPYYVAVKHIIPAEDGRLCLRRSYDSVAREVRTLTHPSLQNNHTILPVLAYGWSNHPLGRRPYLVVDYSDHGTLSQYLKRLRPTLSECRELSLDIAVGLKAVHDCKIVHGDLKPNNVLVFDTLDVTRPQMAKLADFGGSIFESDCTQETAYGGTAMYNAPEQEGRGRFRVKEWRKLEHFYLADVYSFGITLWEIMKLGRSYIDEGWLMADESVDDLLERACLEKNGILLRAMAFCENHFIEGQHSAINNAVVETFKLTLQDEPYERSKMDQVIQTLAYGTRWASNER